MLAYIALTSNTYQKDVGIIIRDVRLPDINRYCCFVSSHNPNPVEMRVGCFDSRFRFQYQGTRSHHEHRPSIDDTRVIYLSLSFITLYCIDYTGYVRLLRDL
jgi:hypothetical protein